MSQINVDTIRSRTGTAPQLDKGAEVTVGVGLTGDGGVNIAGFATAGGFVGNLTGTVTGVATGLSGNPNLGTGVTVYATGIVSATSFYGDGSALTGIAATDNINTNAIQVSGITTFQSLMEPFDFWMFGG